MSSNMNLTKEKKERGQNFRKEEIDSLIMLIEKHKKIIENKKTDAMTWKEKEACWIRLTNEFNIQSDINEDDSDQEAQTEEDSNVVDTPSFSQWKPYTLKRKATECLQDQEAQTKEDSHVVDTPSFSQWKPYTLKRKATECLQVSNRKTIKRPENVERNESVADQEALTKETGKHTPSFSKWKPSSLKRKTTECLQVSKKRKMIKRPEAVERHIQDEAEYKKKKRELTLKKLEVDLQVSELEVEAKKLDIEIKKASLKKMQNQYQFD
ncbi:unnamed protein product [Psylliodes chrysocephalus]|uniref:Regulatory protein zeste n=1 Tax=Psylliodes chrysocephalus TaxID=3402493 RepID=A0A9P0CYR2_9CUCU|nr:unnamed protein product [Psylliodes chrysocephala]